jgi:hypothetical protein
MNKILIIADGPQTTDTWTVSGVIPFSANKWGILQSAIRKVDIDEDSIIYAYASQRTFSYGSNSSSHELTPVELNDLAGLIRREKPNVIFALGGTIMEALCRERGIYRQRGSILSCSLVPGVKVIPTFSVSYLTAVPEDTWIMERDLMRCHAESFSKGRQETLPDYKIGPSFQTVEKSLRSLIDERPETGKLPIAVDIETKAGHIDCIGIAWSATHAICIPFVKRQGTQYISYYPEIQEAVILKLLRELFLHPNVEISGQNFSYDYQHVQKWWNLRIPLGWDTMIVQHCIKNNSKKDLAFLASIWCHNYKYWKDENQEADLKIPETQRWIYNCKDCCYTWEITKQQKRFIELKKGSWPELASVVDFQLSLFQTTQDKMRRGIDVDIPFKNRLSSELEYLKSEREIWLNKACGHPLNPRSPKQMQTFFYGDLNLPIQYDRQTKKPTLNDEALQVLAKKQPLITPIVNRIAEIRSLGVFKSTFVDAVLSKDGKLRCEYKIAGTGTFRYSSSKTYFHDGLNLQNIPKGDE